MVARGVVSLDALHLPVPKTLASKSRISITYKLIQTKGLQVYCFGHLQKTGGWGSYWFAMSAAERPHQVSSGLTKDCRLSANDYLLSLLSPLHTQSRLVSPFLPLHTQKQGVGGTSNQTSFLRSPLVRPFTQKCRRADIPDFSPYISHFFESDKCRGTINRALFPFTPCEKTGPRLLLPLHSGSNPMCCEARAIGIEVMSCAGATLARVKTKFGGTQR